MHEAELDARYTFFLSVVFELQGSHIFKQVLKFLRCGRLFTASLPAVWNDFVISFCNVVPLLILGIYFSKEEPSMSI